MRKPICLIHMVRFTPSAESPLCVLFKVKKKDLKIQPFLIITPFWSWLVHRIFWRVTLSFSAKNEDFCLETSVSGGKIISYKFGKTGNLFRWTSLKLPQSTQLHPAVSLGTVPGAECKDSSADMSRHGSSRSSRYSSREVKQTICGGPD